MAVFKLQLEDFSTTEYELIAIHTTIEVTKLAFLLNKNLNTNFHFFDTVDKTEKNEKGSFDRFLFFDSENETSWNLIENKSIIKVENISVSLFKDYEQYMFMIPEYKKVDFILKIDTEDNFLNTDKIIQTISKIDSISMSYAIDKNKIKTKSNLIF
ncbi:IPExxxVDY family protein [uncultured Flavobacterium sp.]|uniref:IPExxxVDY family protein n=1 Tax=uncultured Flavobacterium sp. TaxID=165435 RepID=UPI0030EBECCC|tara:strand:+ start:87226 stop:87693 length:468 start_codon:yes stop_codon:yes gene_type:complete